MSYKIKNKHFFLFSASVIVKVVHLWPEIAKKLDEKRLVLRMNTEKENK